MKVIGIQKVDFTTRDGNHISGTNLHCTYTDNCIIGEGVEKVFCSYRVETSHISVGDEIRVFYNKYGKPDIIQVL